MLFILQLKKTSIMVFTISILLCRMRCNVLVWYYICIMVCISAFCYSKFCEQVTTGANVWRFLVYHICVVQKLLRKQLLYFFWCILSLILCANDCENSDYFAGNCIREWDVWRPSFCLIFSLILRKRLRESAFFLEHFTSLNWNFVFLQYWFVFPVVSLFAQSKC